jgi:hypothetical protein
MRRALLAALTVVTVCGGCFDERTSFPSGVILCSNQSRLCPSGLTCGAGNLCWAAGDGPTFDAPPLCVEDELRCFGTEQHVCSGGAFRLVTTCGNACVGGYCVECEPDSRRCNGSRPQECGETGSWSDLAACPAATPQCEDGMCLPPCSPVGARRCSRDGLAVQECDQAGQFRTLSMCMNVCVPGTPGQTQATCGGECRPGTAQCGPDHTTETCNASGEWTTGQRCTGVCTGATCSGECRPGATRCNAAGMIETCGTDARWGAPAACTFVCNQATGRCDGVCRPGARRCNGSRAEVCSDAGAWSLDAECAPMQCTDGQCGPCTEDATQCSAGVPQRCDGGIWQDTAPAACPFVCDPVIGCAGECVPGTTTCDGDVRKTCGQDGRYTSETCGLVCVAGQCTGVCEPASRRCNGDTSQTCNSTGEWSGDVSCAHGCDDVTGDCQACVPESHDATCADGGCGVKQNNCGQDVDCGQGACTGIGETCGGGGTPGFCGCTPDPESVTCGSGTRCAPTGNNCGQIVSCPDACVLPQTCGGGGVPGACGCAPADPALACAGKNCGTVSDGCGGTISCLPEGQTACPGAANGDTCGGGGVPNVCGCTPAPMCGDRECGQVANGCGGTSGCGPMNGGCPAGEVCDGAGQCVVNCEPRTECDDGFECGTQEAGCGAPPISCGQCEPPEQCVPAEHDCRCIPRTTCDTGAMCGTQPDGCGGTVPCGTCPTGQACEANRCRCKTKAEACGAQQCGTAFAGQDCPAVECGPCPTDRLCSNKICICRGECGPTCGPCELPETCQLDFACECIPNPLACFELECGPADDGCGRTIECGMCGTGTSCVEGHCLPSTCDPNDASSADPNLPNCKL